MFYKCLYILNFEQVLLFFSVNSNFVMLEG